VSELLTERSGRVVAARKLTRRSGRDDARAFLAEGRQAVGEALAEARRDPDAVREVFATEAAAAAHIEVLAGAPVPVRLVTERAAASLSETVTPQGLVAVCALRDVPAASLAAAPPRLAVALAELADPGNAGTVLRTADACGAGTVVFGSGSADPYNGKVVRSSAGSLFHVDVVRSAPLEPLIEAVQAAGVTVLAADGGGEVALDEAAAEGLLAAPVLWLFGNEARGLSADLAGRADARIRIPMRGRAESLNLSVAASICLYATQLAQG
jgi:TrmH family RNA methyltransferase